MRLPLISIIAAIGSNRELGKDNKLLWNIPEDLTRFKKITEGHPVIMGRKTFQSIGKPLPNRINIIVTREKNLQVQGAIICHSLEQALTIAKNVEEEEIFIIGGASIYQQALPLADKLYLTVVEGKFDADTFFPDYPQFKKIIFEEKHQSDRYTFTYFEILR